MAEPLKNLYNRTFFQALVADLRDEYPAFDDQAFLARIYDDQWEVRELKDRLHHITRTLHETLALPYRKALEVLMPVAARQKNGFEYMFFPDYVSAYGLNDLEASLPALAFFTRFSSSEFAIRPFILAHPDHTMQQMYQWSEHENEHIRRLSSEGCRPRLPWAMALPDFKRDPSPVFPILENLKADTSLYVRKSVANNLNDISKDHPARVLEFARRWIGSHMHTDWILKKACRTLLKNGDQRALGLFGFENQVETFVRDLQLSSEVIRLGEEIGFTFGAGHHSAGTEKLRIEFALYFVKANGSLSRKIFQVTETSFEPGKVPHFSKKYTFKDMTTRKHYAGRHKLAIVVNGEEKAEIHFQVNAQ
ncbi:MAG: DNA alkylation repair protein [Bacteroidia bacterium]